MEPHLFPVNSDPNNVKIYIHLHHEPHESCLNIEH